MNLINKFSLLIVLVTANMVYAQETRDERILESSIENRESQLDYTDVEEKTEQLIKNPLNLNYATEIEMMRIPGLSARQTSALLQHIKAYGRLTSIYELQVIEGFDPDLIRDISRYICIEEKLNFNRSSFNNQVYHHELNISSMRRLEKSAGYQLSDTDRNAFEGDVYKYAIRYKASLGRFNFGVSAEKDAGEHWRNLFLSSYLQFLWSGRLKQVVLGDFQADFGQGLCFGSGMNVGKSSMTMNILKKQDVLKPNRSLNENAFMRGAGAQYRLTEKISLTAFYSNNRIDGTTDTDSMKPGFTSLVNTGKYRNIPEREKQNTIRRKILGANICADIRYLQIGVTVIKTIYGIRHTRPEGKPYKLFDHEGTDLNNYGINYKLFYRNCLFFGETAMNTNIRSLSHIHGVLISLDKSFDISLLFRHYSPSYSVSISNAFGEATANQNETGLYMGCILTPAKHFKLSAYSDVFYFKWLKYQVHAPSRGNDLFVELQYSRKKTYSWYIRYSSGIKQKNEEGIYTLKRMEMTYKNQLRGHVEFSISPSLVLKNRFEYVWYRGDFSDFSDGLLIFQDIQLRVYRKIRLICRYAVFDIGTYDSRIYAYENDMGNSFSVPAFQDKGCRYYLLLSYKMNKNLHICFRFARSSYENADSTGNGQDRIDSNRTTDAGVQFIWKI